VLVVEDEEQVRTLIRRILEGRGYVVLEASSGVEALERLAASGQPVTLAVTDVITPRPKAREFAATFAARYPGVPLLFMSGYSRTTCSGATYWSRRCRISRSRSFPRCSPPPSTSWWRVPGIGHGPASPDGSRG